MARLFVIGGAAGDAVLRRFVALAGGSSSEIVVVATASLEPEAVAAEHVALLSRLGAGTVRSVPLNCRAEANALAPSALNTATAVYFTGGDQLRISEVLGGTQVDSQLRALLRAGRILLAGTSAGAAMMSGTMIVGGDGPGVTTEAVRTGPGLEFLPGVLIDMHFAERGRLNRLLSAVARYPHELGLGIDEDTAILADDDTLEVLGTGSVTVVDAGTATDIRVPAAGPIALAGARIHVLSAGCRFSLATREASVTALQVATGERGQAA